MGRSMSRRRRTSQKVIAIKTTNTWAGLTLCMGALKGRPYGRSGAWGARDLDRGSAWLVARCGGEKRQQDAGATESVADWAQGVAKSEC